MGYGREIPELFGTTNKERGEYSTASRGNRRIFTRHVRRGLNRWRGGGLGRRDTRDGTPTSGIV